MAREQFRTDKTVHGPRYITSGANNTVVHIGKSARAGDKTMDLKVYGSASTNYLESDASADLVQTVNLDTKLGGSIATSYVEFDTSGDQFGFFGCTRPRGFNAPSKRYELKWVAGQRGKPALNAVIALDENSNAAAHLASNVADPDFEILGTNASTDDVTFYAEGGLTIETDGADNDQVIVLPHLDSSQSAWSAVTWGTDKQTEWECDISTGSAITSETIWAGLKLTNTSVTATDDDQVFFRYAAATNSGKWQAISSIGGTDDAADSGVTVAVSTRYHLKITIDSSRIARFYINGVLVETSAALTDAVDLIPYIGIHANTGAAKSMHIHGQAISRVIG